jgi:catechol 2,3-dioxygenase-like lactoylglutathione lyase family enzyme
MPKLGAVTPIMRIFDMAKAREFYLDFLGFEVEFEHRFDDNAPLYMGVVRDGCILHLSEHHGDGAPGVAVRIKVEDIAVSPRTDRQEIPVRPAGAGNHALADPRSVGR